MTERSDNIYYHVCVPKIHVPNLYAYILNYWVPYINSYLEYHLEYDPFGGYVLGLG